MDQTTGSIPYARQSISDSDIDAVVSALRSDYLTQGPLLPEFERAVADYCGAGHAVAVNSGTSALHLACLALGLGTGDSLWTTPITFVASANCALHCRAKVDFVDIDPQTYNLCTKSLERKLESAKRDGCLPSIVVAVHLCGQPCEMARVHELSLQYGFKIIEDASHALGAKYQGEPVGNGRYSAITVFSFHPVKIITTGEGGMAVTNDSALARRMSLLRSHGITRDPDEMDRRSDGPWYYQQIDLGFNYRMTELQAALGMAQMTRLDEWVAQRHILAHDYDDLLRDLPLSTPWQHPDSYSAFHLYVIRLRLAQTSRTHAQVFEGLRSQGIGANLHYIPVYSQPYYARMGFDPNHFPEAESYYSEAITLPMYSSLLGPQQYQVVAALKKALR